MSVRDPKAWMPTDMLDSDKQYFITLHPEDPHAAAASAWEAWAATLESEALVASVSTGAQSISYAKGYSASQSALERASWHRARTKVVSVALGPQYEYRLEDLQVDVIATQHMDPWWEQ
jgi:hypothetical protein